MTEGQGKSNIAPLFQSGAIIIRNKGIGHYVYVMRQSANLDFNPITVNNFAALFKCMPVDRASDSIMAPT